MSPRNCWNNSYTHWLYFFAGAVFQPIKSSLTSWPRARSKKDGILAYTNSFNSMGPSTNFSLCKHCKANNAVLKALALGALCFSKLAAR